MSAAARSAGRCCRQAVAAPLAQHVFTAGKDLLVISIGALLDRPDVIARARVQGRLYPPAGAIAGLVIVCCGLKEGWAACRGEE